MVNMEKLMRIAINKAKEGVRKGEAPFGACIVKNGKIIACAHNLVRKSKDVTAHAELITIKKACKKLKSINLSGCTIYSTCEPCPMCFSGCNWARISKIVYGSRINDSKKLGFNELIISDKKMKQLGKSKIKLVGDVLRKENLELFKSWSKRKDKLVY